MKLIGILLLVISMNVFAAPTLKFTGYKFTEKAGVSGTFKKIDWSIPKNTVGSIDFLKNISLKIDTWSIDAGNSARNVNITESLFKNWGDRYINAKAVKLDTQKKVLVMSMSVGKVTKNVEFKYKTDKNKIFFNSEIDLINLGFENAFSKLSELCSALHTGKDGVAKTWSTVDIEVGLDLI